MAIERWGSLSVKDHKNVSGLITNVLLYDRLVMPMYTESDDRDERAYWIEHDWDPDDQLARRKQLGELAVECAWDKHRRERFRDRYKAAVQLNTDANGEEITRELLIEDENHKMPEGVNHADVFVAYNSEKSSLDGIPREKAEIDQLNDYSQIGVLMAHELGVPKIDDQETALKEAINLSRDLEFRTRRAGLYEFQKTCLGQGMSPKSVVAELRDRSRDLNDYLKKQKFKVRKKACFMLAQTLLGAIGGAFIDPYMAMGGLITIWQFTDINITNDFKQTPRGRSRWFTRYFTDSGIIGGKDFVCDHSRRFKDLFRSKNGKIPSPLAGLDGTFSLKRLSEMLCRGTHHK